MRSFGRAKLCVAVLTIAGCAEDPLDGGFPTDSDLGNVDNGSGGNGPGTGGTGSSQNASGSPSGLSGSNTSANGGTQNTTGSSGTTGTTGTTGEGQAGSGLPAGEAFGDWTWVAPAGALCRDGSPAGYYYRKGQSQDLVIFLNGGGACSDPFFCGLNPANVEQNLPTEALLDATGNVLFGPDGTRQVPPDEGIFKRDPRNPVADWSMVYVPYCTGDVHAGMKPNGSVPGVEGTHQFVGYQNLGLFLESFGPGFASAERVLFSGSSAGGFGVLLNFDRVQSYFDQHGGAHVIALSDSGIALRDEYVPPCLYRRWRDLWNLDAALPADCADCFREDGGHLTEGLGAYIMQKYPDRMLGGTVSTSEDGVIRAFFAAGLDDCTADPGLVTILSAVNIGGYPGPRFTDGLRDVTENVFGVDNIATYIIEGWQHMHLWRPRYYETSGNEMTMADWVQDVIDGKPTHQGKLL